MSTMCQEQNKEARLLRGLCAAHLAEALLSVLSGFEEHLAAILAAPVHFGGRSSAELRRFNGRLAKLAA